MYFNKMCESLKNRIFSKENTPGQLSPIVVFISAKSLVLENVMLSVVVL